MNVSKWPKKRKFFLRDKRACKTSKEPYYSSLIVVTQSKGQELAKFGKRIQIVKYERQTRYKAEAFGLFECILKVFSRYVSHMKKHRVTNNP